MAKQVINIGTSPNDNTGDPLRDAMDKINDNFAEVYTPTIIPETVSRTLLLTDNNNLITMDSISACTVTIPTNNAVAFPIGSCVAVMQLGVGQVTILGPSITLLSPGSLVAISAQYEIVTLFKIAINTWVLSGYLG